MQICQFVSGRLERSFDGTDFDDTSFDGPGLLQHLDNRFVAFGTCHPNKATGVFGPGHLSLYTLPRNYCSSEILAESKEL